MNRGGELLFNFSLAAGKIVEEGVMMDILLRLPVKSLTRFKCVCKSWRDIISDPCFARAHYRCMFGNPNSQRLLLAMEHPDAVPKFLCFENIHSEAIQIESNILDCPVKFKFPRPSRLCMIVGACRGLVCVQIWGDTYSSRTLVVWNPITGAFKDIPLHPDVTDNDDFHIFGFGYDSASDDYKILAYALNGTNGLKLSILAVKEKYWRSICMRHVKSPPIEAGVYANGCLHWLQLYYNHSLEPSCSILSFNLSNEKFETIPPPADIDYMCLFNLAEFRGCLLFYTGDRDYQCQKCWIMEGHGLWSEVRNISSQSGESETTGRVMCCGTDGKVLLRIIRGEGYVPRLIFRLYSPKNNQITPFGNPMMRDTQLFVESLVSP